jgi:Tol biopolymer transport system component
MTYDRESFEDPEVIDRYLALLPRVDAAYRRRLQSRLVGAHAPRRRWRTSMPWGFVPRAVPVLAAVVLLAVALLGHNWTQHAPGATRAVPNRTIALGEVSVSNQQIAFAEPLGPNSSSLDVMNRDGSGLRRLVGRLARRCTIYRSGACNAVWSPDGRRIAFDTATNGRNGSVTVSVYVMNANGSGKRRVASWEQEYIRAWGESLAWSPDGTRLAIARQGSLYVLALKTGAMRRLTAPASGADLDPAWSPDGSRIAFAHAPGCGSICPLQPYIVNVGGRGLRRLSALYGELTCGGPLWSPDGRAIAFCASKWGVHALNKAIYAMDPDGSHLRMLVPAPPTGANQQQALAGWSPDGRHILYFTFPWNSSKGPQATALWMMNANGTGRRRLYRAGDANIGYATWTPDGQRIVFSVGTGLYIMDINGSHVQRIFP